MPRPPSGITKGHETSPVPPASRLNEEQLQGAQWLLQGLHDYQVAEKVGVVRETVSKWRTNPFFQAHLNAERQALWASAQERLRALVHLAIDILEQNLKKSLEDGKVYAAIELLKIVNVYGTVPPPSGPTDPEEIVFREVQTWQATEKRLDTPQVDPVQLLLDPDAGKDARRLHERLQAVRQVWGMAEARACGGREPSA